MRPSIGRIVHVLVDPAQNNGNDVAPAIITRVWTDRMVNVKVLTDGPHDLWQTSLDLLDVRPSDNTIKRAAFWPPKVV